MNRQRTSHIVLLLVLAALCAALLKLWPFDSAEVGKHVLLFEALREDSGAFYDEVGVARVLQQNRESDVVSVIASWSWSYYPPASPPSHMPHRSSVPEKQVSGIILLDLSEEVLNEQELDEIVERYATLEWLRVPRYIELKRYRFLEGLDLKGLGLGRSVFDGRCLHDVARMKKLSWLNLYATSISNHDLAALENCLGLRYLNIGETRIDDSAVVWISRHLVGLRTLIIHDTAITDSGVEALSRLTEVEHLNAAWCPLTDSSLETFAKLGSLKMLNVKGTRMSKVGLDRFRAERPEVRVSASW